MSKHNTTRWISPRHPIKHRSLFINPLRLLLLKKNQNLFKEKSEIVVVVVVVVLTLKNVTLKGKETNFRGHKLTQNKIQKNKIKGETTQQGAPRSFCDTTGYSFLSSWNERS